MVINKQISEFQNKLVNSKYKNILQDLILEQCPIENKLIWIKLIKIKNSQRRKGYGDAVIDDIINFADIHKLRIKLSITDIYGIDIEFYKKHGFTLINPKEMIYYPTEKSN